MRTSFPNQKMVDVNLSGLKGKVTDKIIKTLGVQTAIEATPKKMVDTIQPIINVEDGEITNVYSSFLVSTTSTFLTTPTDKDVYLEGAQVYYSSDSTVPTNTVELKITLENGKRVSIFAVGDIGGVGVPIVSNVLPLNKSIKLKRGTTVTLERTSTTGNLAGGHIYLREED